MARDQNSDAAHFKYMPMPESRNQLKRICYSCQNIYPDMVRFCPLDGTDLDYVTRPIEELARDFDPRVGNRAGLWCMAATLLSVLLLAFAASNRLTPTGDNGMDSGELLISTNPSGATIYLDGSQVGVTPVRLAAIPTGVHYLRAVFPGYKNEGARIEILPSSKKRLEMDLAPLPSGGLSRYVAELSVAPESDSFRFSFQLPIPLVSVNN